MSGLPDPARLLDAVPALDRLALLLDLDGTLLDIAPTPAQVAVAPGLRDALLRLRAGVGDALAVVTGRPVEQVDALLPGVPFAVAGEHGGAIRFAPGAPVERAPLPAPPGRWDAEAEAIAAAHPGALLERKRRGFVLHYRAAPNLNQALHEALRVLLASGPPGFQLMAAHMAWEVRPAGADKGTAVAAVMSHPPFAGRLPVFVGDDVTDEDGMRAARALGGEGLRVPDVFGDAAGVRAWIGRLAGVG